MPHEDKHIRARFWVNSKSVTIYATYQGIKMTLRWPRTDDDAATTRHLNTFIGNLPRIVMDGLQEVIIQAALKDLDQEWLDMDEPPAQEEPTSE